MPPTRYSLFSLSLFLLMIACITSTVSLDEATANYIHALYQKKRYTEVMTEVRSYLSRFPLSAFFSEVAILGGEAAYKEKNHYLSRYFFEQAFKNTKNTRLLKQSLLGMAKSSYKIGSYQEAAKLFETYVTEFDDPLVNPAALYYAAVCAIASGNSSEASRYQSWLAREYPDSPYISLLTSPLPSSSSPSHPTKETTSPTPPSSSLNEVAFAMPHILQRETTNTVIITNWIHLTTTNETPSSPSRTLTLDDNTRYLSLLEVKARLLQLKAKALDEELASLGIGGLE
ncbi:MAG: hypothetical protein N2314_09270 [Brevinematales bacterium]|nr:hypothetical protein [Brevinematales bacterium]